jgi:hypothetical protein
MADQIKEISNGTYGIGALTNGVPIANTDADTQYVVKDIYVQNNQLTSVGATLDFVVNGINVADIDASVSGSEIIDVSSTAVAQTTASFDTQVFENWMITSVADSRINTRTGRTINGFQSSAVLAQSTAIATAPTNSSQIVSWAFVGADFYYYTDDGNSVQNLYRRAGGVNGTQTQIASISNWQPVVFNGVDKFHWVTGSQIFTHNATTNTNSAVNLIAAGTSWNGSINSTPRISFANGLVFLQNSSHGVIFAINPTTGRMSNIVTFTPTATNVAMGVFHTSGAYYFLNTGDVAAGITGAIRVTTCLDTNVGPLTSVNTSTSTTQIYNQNTYTPRNALVDHWPKMTPNGYFVFMSVETSGSVYVYKRFNVVTQTFATPFTINVSTITPNSGTSYSVAPIRTLSVSSDSANKLNTTFYPQTATLRVTGVETTL